MRAFRYMTLQDYVGGVGLFMMIIVSLLLVTTTTIAARLSMSEAEQASEVDQSDAAYYAAEAGIMEAAHRIDVDSERSTDITGGAPTPLEEIFPEQYEHGENGGDRHGDRAVLGDGEGNFSTGSQLNIEPDEFDDHSELYGRIAWRQRQVYEEPRMPFGTQVKDESVELDLTSLRQLCDPQGFGGDNDDYAGEDGQDCDGNDIFALMDGMEYCWSRDVPGAARPEFEVTILSYPSGNATNIATDKVKVDANTSSGVSVAPGVTLQMSSSDGSYENCMEFEFSNSNRRYIFRIKPLFDEVNAQSNPDEYRVDYQTRLLHDDPQDRPLFIARNTVIIDSVGQSGETRRRIVARKDRDGRVLGIFDFTLYSGGPTPLCKPGVQQDDVVYDEFCRVDGADNSTDPGDPTGPPPTQPESLTATSDGSDTIHLNWQAGNRADSYTIERDGTIIATGISNTSYTDRGLQSRTTYTYRVRSENDGGSSSWSDSASATTAGDAIVYDQPCSVNEYTVPNGVGRVAVEAYGAQGGSNGGRGGRTEATISVSSGEELYVYVGGMGGDHDSDSNSSGGSGGCNGGGDGGDGGTTTGSGAGGGGASDVRRGNTSLSSRVVVAAGGGGDNRCSDDGGYGGGLSGGDGADSSYYGSWGQAYGGGGGSQSSGGYGGSGYGSSGDGESGSFGYGGAGGRTSGGGAGGGGGGYYGGGGGGSAPYTCSAAGGGGSSYVASGTNTSFDSSANSGHGEVTLTPK